MSVSLAPPPFLQFLNPNNSGSPAVGYQLFTYIAGSTTKQATWTDSTQTVENANPLDLDGNGVGTLWGDPTLAYKLVLAPANDTDPPTSPIRTVDNFYFPTTLAAITQTVLGGILYPRTNAEIYAAVTRSLPFFPSGQGGGSTLNVLAYFTAVQEASYLSQDGLQDMTAAWQAANNFLEGLSTSGGGGGPHPGGTLYMPGGQLNISSTIRVGGNVTVKGDQFQGTTINVNSSTFSGVLIQLGPDESGFFSYSGSYTMGSAMEDLHISLQGNNQISIVINTAGAHQGSHLKNIKIQGVNQYGINLGGTGGPAYFWMEDINIQGGAGFTSPPTDREGIRLTTGGGYVRCREITIEGASGQPFNIAIRPVNAEVLLENIHTEVCTTGIYFDPGGTNATSVIKGWSGSSTCTQLIWIPAGYTGTVTAIGINGLTGSAGQPIAIKNDNTGESYTNFMGGVYSWSGTPGVQTGSFAVTAIHNTPHIRYGKSITQAIAQNTFVVLTFPTLVDDWQSGGTTEWSGSVYTPYVPGRYRVTVSCLLASAAWTAGAVFRLYLQHNNSTFSTNEDDSAVGTFARQLQITDTIYCAVGDTIRAGVFQGAVASVNTDSSTATCYIAIDRE